MREADDSKEQPGEVADRMVRTLGDGDELFCKIAEDITERREAARRLPDEFLLGSGDPIDRAMDFVRQHWASYDAESRIELVQASLGGNARVAPTDGVSRPQHGERSRLSMPACRTPTSFVTSSSRSRELSWIGSSTPTYTLQPFPSSLLRDATTSWCCGGTPAACRSRCHSMRLGDSLVHVPMDKGVGVLTVPDGVDPVVDPGMWVLMG